MIPYVYHHAVEYTEALVRLSEAAEKFYKTSKLYNTLVESFTFLFYIDFSSILS